MQAPWTHNSGYMCRYDRSVRKESKWNEMLRSSRVHYSVFVGTALPQERLRESCEERARKMEWLLCVHACLLPGKRMEGVAWPHRVIAGVGHPSTLLVCFWSGNQRTRVGMGMRQLFLVREYQDACFEMNQWTSVEIEPKEDIGNAFLAEPLATGVRSVNVKEPCTAYANTYS
jgi:hypothetical protein